MEACVSSDHNAIAFTIGETADRPSLRSSTYFFNNKTANWQRFHEALSDEMGDVVSENTIRQSDSDGLETIISEITDAIRSACRLSMKIRGNCKPYNPWWTAELEAMKKEVIRLHHRLTTLKRRGSDLSDAVRQHSDGKAAYAKAIKKAATDHFRSFCQAQGKENVWDLTARLIKDAPRQRAPATLRSSATQQFTSSSKETAEALLRQFYPDDGDMETCPTDKNSYDKKCTTNRKHPTSHSSLLRK